MAKQITKLASINGWKNLWTQALADGYAGSPVVKSGTIFNINATIAYVHFTSDGSTNPTTAADGIGIDTASSPSSSISFEDVDIAGVWINTSGAQDIRYTLVGG